MGIESERDHTYVDIVVGASVVRVEVPIVMVSEDAEVDVGEVIGMSEVEDGMDIEVEDESDMVAMFCVEGTKEEEEDEESKVEEEGDSREEEGACLEAVAVASEDRPEPEALVELTLTIKAGLLPANDYTGRIALAMLMMMATRQSS